MEISQPLGCFGIFTLWKLCLPNKTLPLPDGSLGSQEIRTIPLVEGSWEVSPLQGVNMKKLHILFPCLENLKGENKCFVNICGCPVVDRNQPQRTVHDSSVLWVLMEQSVLYSSHEPM